MADLLSSLGLLLRAPDEIKVTLLTSLVPYPNSAASIDSSPTLDQDSRILAVISHRDELDRHEEGSLFVFKRNRNNKGPDDFDIQRVFPIFGNFSISMAQMTRETLDLSTSKSNVDQLRSGLRMTINPGQTFDGHEPLSLFTYDVQGLKDVLSECKHLKELSDFKTNAGTSPAQTYSWLAPYVSGSLVSNLLSTTPPDLRIVKRPFHTRLSEASAGQPGSDVDDLFLIRDEWVRRKAREKTRRDRRQLNIRIGTFNVNGRAPSQDLSTWIRGAAQIHNSTSNLIPPLEDISPLSMGEISRNPFEKPQPALSSRIEGDTLKQSDNETPNHSSTDHLPISNSSSTLTLTADETEQGIMLVDSIHPEEPDLLVLGFQEVDLSTEALLYSTGTAKEDAWCMAVFAALGEKADWYEKLASKQLVGMLIVVIVKKSLKSCFSDIQTSGAGVGIMGVMANKGGTAIRLNFTPPKEDGVTSTGSTVITFVNSHLAAFDAMKDRRDADFQDLSKRLTFSSGAGSSHPLDTIAPIETANVFESDILFWMGDLNYRLDLPDADVRSLLASNSWHDKFDVLQKHDQLKASMRTKKAFEMFSEPPIGHLPTYRFSPGLLTDSFGYDLKRKPAWTDRILQTCSPSSARVQQKSYSGHPEITMSDHRPVSADFSVDLDVYDRDLWNAEARHLYRQVEGMEKSPDRARVKLDVSAVDLGKVSYKRTVSRKLSLRNVGKIPSAYRFVAIDSGSPIHPEWLRIEPMTGLLLPDELVDITLTAFVDNAAAFRLNMGPRELDSTLILHILMGKDDFISVSGEYEYTCFANKLSRLTRLPGPIRSLTSPDNLLAEDRSINAPREIMRLVNRLMSIDDTVGIFDTQADQTLVNTIRECLDTGSEFSFPADSTDPKLPTALGFTLLQLLDSLPEPVVPVSLHGRCLAATTRDEAFEVLDDFPPVSVNVWISVTAFLHFIVQSSPSPESEAEKIAAKFAMILLREDSESASLPTSPIGKQNFIMYFLG